MNLWFTGDDHFEHEKVIKYSKRPFASLEEMHEILIENWNRVVHPRDIVWHVGDFSLGKHPERFTRVLNGQINICLGNHDYKRKNKLIPLFNWVGDVRYLRYKDERFFISHYAHRTWRRSNHGSYHVYGHSHGDLPPFRRSMDVGVDSNNFTPIHIDEVIGRLSNSPINDHHHPDRE